MGQSTIALFQGQARRWKKRKKQFPEPFPNYSLEEILPLNLVGYARVLSKVSKTQESYHLSLSDEYLMKLWECSKSTARRILNQLVQHGVVLKMTSKPVQKPDGDFVQKRILLLRPINPDTQDPKSDERQIDYESTAHRCSNVTTQIDTHPSDEGRTIQRPVESSSIEKFIELGALKSVTAKKKKKPSPEIKNLQIRFLKKAIDRLIDEDEINYRFICLILRNVLGGNGATAAYYAERIHLSIRHKPELLISTLELMISSYSDIVCPVGWLISELQGVVGIEPKQKPTNSVESIKSIESIQPKSEQEGFQKRVMKNQLSKSAMRFIASQGSL